MRSHHIKGGRDIPAQTKLRLREEEEKEEEFILMNKKKKRPRNSPGAAPEPQTQRLISPDPTLPPCANTAGLFKPFFHPSSSPSSLDVSP